MMNDARILVIVVTYNGVKYIENCLRPLQSSGANIETIVVDNGSTDETLNIVRERFPEVKVVETNKNLGFGAANNIGFRYALEQGFDYVYLLNQDAWISPEDIGHLVEINRRNPEFGIISPLHLYRGMTKMDDNFSHTLPRTLINDWVVNIENKPDVYSTGKRMVQAAHWLIPCEVVRKTGGFSPAFFHYGEDHNYCHRVWYWGYDVGIAPSVHAVHDRETRVDSEEKKIYLLGQQWRYRFSDPRVTTKYGLWTVSKSFRKSWPQYKFKLVKPLIKFLKELKELQRIKRLSGCEGAFLNNSE